MTRAHTIRGAATVPHIFKMIDFYYPVTVAVALKRCTAEVIRITFPVDRPKTITADRMIELCPSGTWYAFVYSRRFKQYFIFIDSVERNEGTDLPPDKLLYRCMNIWAVVGDHTTVLLKRNVHVVSGSPVWTSSKASFEFFNRLLLCNQSGLRSDIEDSWVTMMKKYDDNDAQEEADDKEMDAMERMYDDESDDEEEVVRD